MRLFHYTTLDAALKIISGQRVWLSDSLEMNDTQEGVHIREVALPFVERLTREIPNSPQEDYWWDVTLQSRGYFLFSLSAEGDLLEQWRSYGDSGAGVALEIDLLNSLLNSSAATHEEPLATPVSLIECIYDKGEQERRIGKLIEEHRQAASNGDWDSLWQALAAHAIAMKHPSFHFEKEYRLAYCQSFVHSNNDVRRVPGNLGHKTWRKGKHGLTSHYEYTINVEQIRGVRVGPAAGVLDRRMFREMLSELKWSGWPVSSSECPYR